MSSAALTINFGFIAEDPFTKECLHFVGFADHPEEKEFDSIFEELRTDEELGLTKTPFEFRRATTQEVIEYRKILRQNN